MTLPDPQCSQPPATAAKRTVAPASLRTSEPIGRAALFDCGTWPGTLETMSLSRFFTSAGLSIPQSAEYRNRSVAEVEARVQIVSRAPRPILGYGDPNI